ncbi:hypothetical protein GCM10011491_19150 [Brucella endophytica]|uniref:CAAX prenyl protease 2/Lysostaphin resistance protein A-like domain-containing protein n=1 Tax=Brucella endophytica TaxID=1963359 RepID=A0A916SAS0_9HYPH|nr:CPBP family intramembrane glutamic endopeptidase [Brucella endophytica]GGA91313.1 hypothetical protein GCM10011491_19150 [Brucella endophytica]
MALKIRILIHAALFSLAYSYVYPFLKHFLPEWRFPAFDYLNELTGFPPLESRILHFLFAVVLYALFAVLWERENWKDAFFLRDSPKGLLKGAAFALLLALGALALYQLAGLLDIEGIIPDHQKTAALILAWFVAQAFNAVQEELVFRGYLLRHLAGHFNKHASVALVSLIFGMGHIAQYDWTGFIFATVGGAIFGYVYLFYRNIYVPIGMHGVWDICSHTLVNTKILLAQPGPLMERLGDSAGNNALFLTVVGVHVLFLAAFFIWKRLWRL